jgi:plasmid stabilization system protein ParE
MKPVWKRPRAIADVDQIAACLFGESPSAGERFAANFEDTLQRIAKWPSLGRVREDMDPLFGRVRSLTIEGFPNHLVVHDELPDAILILRVLHGSRRIGPGLLE